MCRFLFSFRLLRPSQSRARRYIIAAVPLKSALIDDGDERVRPLG